MTALPGAATRTAPTTSPATTPRLARSRRRGPAPRTVWRVVLSALALLLAALWAFPVYWMLISSLMPNVRLTSGAPTFWPTRASLDNFSAVLDGGTFLPALRMSLAITCLTVALAIVLAFLAALAVSRYRFTGRRSFVLTVLVVQMLPAEGLFIAQYKLLGSAQLLNSVIGISVLYAAAVVPFTIWMLRGFVAGVPVELEEAAMVDGLSRWQAFTRITLPLLAPGLIASGVYAFLQAWNEFTLALVVLPAESAKTLPVWLRGFVQASVSREVDWGQVMAASTLLALPVIVFFLLVQRRMTSGLVSGAVKG